MKTKRIILMMALVLPMAFMSCEKDDDNNLEEKDETEKDATGDNSVAMTIYNNVSNISDEAKGGSLNTFKSEGANAILSGCATISFDSTSTNTLIVDFGTSNCLCIDGRNRRGKIIVNYTGWYWAQGTVLNYTFDSYYVNDHKVEGTKTVTNLGIDSSNVMSFDIVEDGTIEKPNGAGTIIWKSTRKRKWVEGVSTPFNWLDDAWEISGSANGVDSEGRGFTANILQDLRKEMTCKYLVSGIYEYTPQGITAITIDYGNGTCDNKATVSFLGQSSEITLN